MQGPHGVCYCENYVEVQKLVAPAGCAEDAAAVAALPEEWSPKRGGPILANYLRRREQDHQAVMWDLADRAAEQNVAVDAKIRTLAENLLSHIKQNQTDINCAVEQRDTGAPLLPSDRNEALKDVTQLYCQRIEDISNFKREALALERERAAGLSELLRDQFQRLVAVAHKSPKDLLHEFDERTYEANQQLLSNSRAYSELEAKLRFQADENVRRAKSSLNQLCLGVQLSFRRHSAQLSSQNMFRSRQSTHSADSKRTLDVPLVESLLDNVLEIEDCVSRIVYSYKNAVMQAVSHLSVKLVALCAGLENRRVSHLNIRQDDEEELHKIVKRALDRISRKLPTSNSTISFQDVTRIQTSLDNLGKRLQTTYLILRDAGHLWDAHIMRLALVQKLTIAAVEDLLTNNDGIELANEVQFNIAFEAMRSCPEVDKILHQYDDVMALLEKTAELYNQHREAEVSRLQEFMNVVPTMADTLIAEFSCYLEKYPREQCEAVCIELSKTSTTISESTPIRRVVLQSEMQATALSHWKNGFLESFKCSFSQVPEELGFQAGSWVQERKSALDLRYAMKMMSHSIRAERVKGALESRKSQILHHDSRLASHIEAINAFMDNLPGKLEQAISFETPDLYPIHRWIDSIQTHIDELLAREELDPETKRLKMLSFSNRLTKHTQLFSESLEDAVVGYKKEVDNRIQAARISNIRFLSAIKLFYEGGCYSAQESLKTLAVIVKTGEALELCSLRSSDMANQRHSQLHSLVEQRVAALRRHTEEYAKPVGKGALKKTQSSAQTRKKK